MWPRALRIGNTGSQGPKHTVLAGERVYFVGHPVAVVVAVDRFAGRDALDLIEVDYETAASGQ